MTYPILPAFRPLTFFANPHVQTIVGNLLPDGVGTRWSSRRHKVVLADGDRLVVHDTVPPGWENGDPAALLVHGMGGCYRSSYIIRLLDLLARRGFRVLRVDLRGCGAGIAFSRKIYNAACSPDVRAVVAWLYEQAPTSPLVMVGLSLGGNIVLKLAGETAHYPVPNLHKVVAISAPLDLSQCVDLLAQSRFYTRFYVHNLVRHVRLHQRYFPDLPRTAFPRVMDLELFDDLYTAPRGGFASARDYYRQASCGPLLAGIRVPALLLTSRDDPYINPDCYERVPGRPNLHIHIADHGGHLGFLGWDGGGGIRWAERQAVDWLSRGLVHV